MKDHGYATVVFQYRLFPMLKFHQQHHFNAEGIKTYTEFLERTFHTWSREPAYFHGVPSPSFVACKPDRPIKLLVIL